MSTFDSRKYSALHFYEINFYAIDGKVTFCRTAKEVLTGVFEEFTKRDPTFCERFAIQKPGGHVRQYVARSRQELYPNHRGRQEKESFKLPGGWWLGTHTTNRTKREWIALACKLAGYTLGRDFDFTIP